MLRALFIACITLIIASNARAQEIASPEVLASETYQTRLPGPRANELRSVFFWRPPGVEGPLPVLYMADGLAGIKIAVSRLRAEVVAGRARPFMVVAIESSQPPRRMKEYVPGEDQSEFDVHFAWFVGSVIPWAERNAGASSRADERGVGGVSNGADFAIAAAARRPDLFTRVLAHSPVNEPHASFTPNANTHWALTAGGMRDYDGRARTVQSQLINAIGEDASLRRCRGPWAHDLDSWLDVSPGAIAWLFDLAPQEVVSAPLEQRYCETHAALTPSAAFPEMPAGLRGADPSLARG